MAVVPQIESQIETATEVIEIPSKTYKLNTNVVSIVIEDGVQKIVEKDRIAGFVDNLDAVKQSIYHILSTK